MARLTVATPLSFRPWGDFVRILLLLCALLALAAPAAAQKRIALSFDDVPRGRGAFFTPDERSRRLIAQLKKARVKQAVFFLNPGKLGDPDGAGGEARINAYVRAGHVLANHSYSHPQLTDMDAEAYLADIDQASAWLKGRKGTRPWFRFPYLNEGRDDKVKRDAIRAGLKARGLRNGYVTIDGCDWNIEALTAKARADGKPMDMAALRNFYVTTHVEAADFFDQLAVKTIGRSPAHMLLLHETDIAAMFVGDLVAALRADGWEIVSADTAYADPIGEILTDVPSHQGTLTELMAWQKGLPAPRWYARNDTQLMAALFREQVLKEE